MKITDTGDLWWKNAVVYCLDAETFMDWNDDGVGDFPGLAQRLDHLAELGVTCLWLMPFYTSAERDDGYDIIDFYGVDSRLGTHGDLVELIRTARDRGIRVIADLVVNHTSDQHPWFVQSRSSKDNPFRDFYVWRADEPPDTSDQVVFPDQEDSIWELDETTGEYYLHRFYKHQPDLNVANPHVRDEIAKVMGFWLELGLSGFRVDAVPYLLEGAGGRDGNPDGDPHDYLRSLRSFLGRRSGDAILLGEVNLPYPEQIRFFGDGAGDELSMMFDFVGMQQFYLALARQDARPAAQALRDRPEIPVDAQWATFVRNHDELTLDKLTDDERQEVFDAFGPEESMQLFGRGLRRRLPPMLDGDPRRIRMVYSLLFSVPGTPVLFYGEEIGMGENLDVPGRLAVRTPMQWTAQRNGGFSHAEPDDLVAPVVTGGFGPEHINVAAQRNDPDSLLNFIGHLARRYRECPELGWARGEVLDQPHHAVLAHRCTWDDSSLVAVHNLSAEPCVVPLVLDDVGPDTELVDLLQEGRVTCSEDGTVQVPIGGYGYRWLRVVQPGSRRLV
ncbi:alpha-amylase family protein [Cellulomonas sp. ATA003]|uniref:alpha-amylase family protein n=1 Tax=Cellulomonas sp. ATA003 TaxID=3073064 RepID=UPI0028737D93|nr:alpha-amylase family protein [Cellulomonas sp. ATA003]WNB85549.1 alpha-amylase family protein [Cellulomonas sp. ATA003]